MPEKKQNRNAVKRKEQPTQAGNGKGKNYLLTIGINKYINYNPLFNAVEDAEGIAKVLTERYGFEDTFTLYDEEATRDNILGQLEELEELITPKDNLLIFYAGHGFYHKKTGYLVPQNAPSKTRRGLIANSTFIENLKTIDAHHILLIFDSCFSGSLIVSRDIQIHSVAERVGRIRSRYAISAGNIELVSDGVVGNHSPFTKAIVDYLQQNKVAQLPVSHLFTEIRKITTYNAEQTPLGGPIPRMDNAGGEFIFELENIEPTPVIINAKEETAWQLAESQKSISGYLRYLIAFPQGKYITKAYEQMEILEQQFSLPKSVSKEEKPTEAPNVLSEVERKKRLEAMKSLGPHWKRVLPGSGTFTDERDGQTYKILKLKDGKTWMVQNFNFDAGVDCWHYDNDPKRGVKYGRLYSWEAAKKACPAGWRLPNMEEDWLPMVDLYGGFFNYHNPKSDLYNNGEKAFHNLMTNEDVGFMAKLGGLRNCKGDFRDLALTSAYWTNTLRGEHILSCNFDKDDQTVMQVEAMDCLAYSCRYVKIEEEKLAKPIPISSKEKIIKPIAHIVKDSNSFTDPRDGQIYKTVKLEDGNTWMAENLNFDLPPTKEKKGLFWNKTKEQCWVYDNKVNNGELYGRLYSWEAALKSCPDGWHLPSDEEWRNLVHLYGGEKKASIDLIDGGSSKFSALLGGYRDSDGDFNLLGIYGSYWSSSEYDSSSAWYYLFFGGNKRLSRSYNLKSWARSCRCLQD